MPLSEREEIHKTIAECNAESGIDIENIWSLGTGDFSVQDQKTKVWKLLVKYYPLSILCFIKKLKYFSVSQNVTLLNKD